MSSNTVTENQLVESIKNFRFNSKDNKEEIEIAIPEVNKLLRLSHSRVLLHRFDWKT